MNIAGASGQGSEPGGGGRLGPGSGDPGGEASRQREQKLQRPWGGNAPGVSGAEPATGGHSQRDGPDRSRWETPGQQGPAEGPEQGRWV